MSSTQLQHQGGSQRQRRILTLDAGGVNSLSSLTILRRIMDDFNILCPLMEELHPWQVFDMIAGTETGGLIAIMLGRLRMSIDECEESFKTLCRTIHQPRHPLAPLRPNQFDSEVLAQAVKNMVHRKVGPRGPVNIVETTQECKVIVGLTTPGKAGFRVITSYPRPRVPQEQYMDQRGHESYEVWEVCAATTASAGFFDPVMIRDVNRHEELYCPSNVWDEPKHFIGPEFAQLWPGESGLVVSIGSGVKPRQFPGQVTTNYGYNLDMWFNFHKDAHVHEVRKEDFAKFDQIQRSATAHLGDHNVSERLRRYINKLCRTFSLL